MIEDEEFRGLFKIESEEHLQSLDDGLLALEKTPHDEAILAEVFRAAHSIKGASRMMGLPALERVSHELESVLGRAKGGKEQLSAETIDCLCVGVDAMRALCAQAVGSESVEVDVDSVVAAFRDVEIETEPQNGTKENVETYFIEEEPLLESVSADPSIDVDSLSISADRLASDQSDDVSRSSPGEQKPTREVSRIESIRVSTDRLDGLVAQAGELVVLRNRYVHRLSEFQKLADVWRRCKKPLDTLREDVAQSAELPVANSFLDMVEKCVSDIVELGSLLKELESGARDDTTRLGFLTESLEDEVRALRMLPIKSVFNLFPRLVRDLARSQGKEVELCIQGAETCADKAIIEDIKDPLSHMIRNAIDHGIETPDERLHAGKTPTAMLNIEARQSANSVIIEISDDGRGLDAERIKAKAIKSRLISAEEAALMPDQQVYELIFFPGFSTADLVTDISGRGVGMDVVRHNVEKLKGAIEVESSLGAGTSFRMSFPLTLATTRALIFQCEEWRYALPVDYVDRALMLDSDTFLSIGGTDGIMLGSEVIPIFRLADLIPVSKDASVNRNELNKDLNQADVPCVIIEQRGEKVGLVVDELQSEQEIVLKPHSDILERVRNVACSTILETGEICLVLNGADLLRTVSKESSKLARTVVHESVSQVKRILLAEDSLTTRTQEKRILEAAGYEVVAAVDGADALEKLGTNDFDLVVSDIEMPRLDGLSLAKKIREQSKYADLPIILVTSLASDEDKRRGSEAGANAYITKGSFDHQLLLDTIGRFI